MEAGAGGQGVRTLDLGPSRAAGFRDLITKPFDLDTLARQVKVLLGDHLGSASRIRPTEG
jgi:hypothetical protein